MIYAGSLLLRKTSRSRFIEIGGNVIANKSTSPKYYAWGVASARPDVEFILSNNECPRAFISEYSHLLFRVQILDQGFCATAHAAFSGRTSARTSARPTQSVKIREFQRTFSSCSLHAEHRKNCCSSFRRLSVPMRQQRSMFLHKRCCVS